MHPLLLCTGNQGKLAELKAMLPLGRTVFSLKDLDLPTDLPETGTTLEDNALQKAGYGHQYSGLMSIADDSGLEVDALAGAPGVYSARYAGPSRDDRANMAKVLKGMEGVTHRRARFRTVIALVHQQGQHLFEGVVEGEIATTPRGDKGFGYDPIFIPEGYDRTFAELEADEKNSISHRGKAMRALVEFLGRS